MTPVHFGSIHISPYKIVVIDDKQPVTSIYDGQTRQLVPSVVIPEELVSPSIIGGGEPRLSKSSIVCKLVEREIRENDDVIAVHHKLGFFSPLGKPNGYLNEQNFDADRLPPLGRFRKRQLIITPKLDVSV